MATQSAPAARPVHQSNANKAKGHHNSATVVPRRRHSELELEANEAALEKRKRDILRERRILAVMTCLCCLASVVWLVALFTDYWVMVSVAPKNATDGTSVLKSHLGVWRGCVITKNANPADPSAQSTDCSYHNLDVNDQELKVLPAVAKTIVDYRRTVIALAALSLLCHAMAVSFSFYTFRNPRYTFKRLAGCIHFITAATMVVLIEVVSNGAAFAKSHLLAFYPLGSTWYHGYSYYLAWLVFAQFGLAGLCFMLFSRKRKNLNIVGDDGMPLADDEPQFMGRN